MSDHIAPLVIAIDYDFTYTADPALWYGFIMQAQGHGHTVIRVTGRTEPPFPHEIQFPKMVAIICAGDEEKAKAAIKAGYKVNIWIDDMPGTIEPLRKLQWE